MPNIEIYDYLSNATADVNQTLSVNAKAISTFIDKKDVVCRGDDNDPASTTRIDFSGGNPYVEIRLNHSALTESEKGTILQFWLDSDYGNGRINSFKFAHPHSHTYVVYFKDPLTFMWDGVNYSAFTVLEVVGRIAE